MNADFLDSHRRHWEDAERLFFDSRWANADHLYGLAAECGLKRLMLAFGMGINALGVPLDNKDKSHANKVWIRYETYRSGHLSGANYPLPEGEPFGDWDVSQRYAHKTNFNQGIAKSHQDGAKAVCRLLDKAILDGVVI